MLRVLHVVGAMNRAGTETMLMNIFRNMDREKVMFDFVSYSEEEADYDDEIRGLGGKVINLSRTYNLRELVKVIKMNGPYDAVHSHTLFHCGIANTAAKLAGIKVRIAHAHTTSDKNDTLLRKLYIESMKSLIKLNSTDLLACSDQAGSYLFGKRMINKKVYSYLPNAINYKQFLNVHPADVKNFKSEQDLENNLVIGHIGRFIEPKNHSFLLEITKKLIEKRPDTKLVLVGDGDLRTQIEHKAKQQGISDHIKFVGLRNDINTILHSMDVFVFPSIYEGLGLVLLEAQASGLPCIVSEAVQPEADLELGLFHRAELKKSAKIWAEKIIKVAKTRETDVDKISRAFEKQNYTLPKSISKLTTIYNQSWRLA